jgi:hypothetical protein
MGRRCRVCTCGCVRVGLVLRSVAIRGDSDHLGIRYFLWDTLDAIFNFVDLGFVVHGVCAVGVFIEVVERLNAGTACSVIYIMSFVHVFPCSVVSSNLTSYSCYADSVHGILWLPLPFVGDVRVFSWSVADTDISCNRSTFFLNNHWCVRAVCD